MRLLRRQQEKECRASLPCGLCPLLFYCCFPCCVKKSRVYLLCCSCVTCHCLRPVVHRCVFLLALPRPLTCADQSSIAVTLSQAVAVRDDAALSSCLESEQGQRSMRAAAIKQLLARAEQHLPLSSMPHPAPPRARAVQDAAIIDNSVAKLSAAHAVALLELLVERLQQHPQQAARLAPWLRSLLLAHGPALATAPAGQVRLERGRHWHIVWGCEAASIHSAPGASSFSAPG